MLICTIIEYYMQKIDDLYIKFNKLLMGISVYHDLCKALWEIQKDIKQSWFGEILGQTGKLEKFPKTGCYLLHFYSLLKVIT